MPDDPTILIITGVSGSGKTTIATALAQRLHWPFREGADLHPASDIFFACGQARANQTRRWSRWPSGRGRGLHCGAPALVQRELVAPAVELVAAILKPVRPRDQYLTSARGAHLVGPVSVDKLPAAGGV